MRVSIARLLSFLVVLHMLVSVLSGCAHPIDRGLTLIDRAEQDLRQDSDQWQAILQRVASQLPTEIQSTIRVEANQLVTRSIARSGDELSCRSDFYARRVSQGLERLRAMIRNQPVPSVEPAICQVIDASLDLNLSPERRRIIELHGYDLDQRDSDGQLLWVTLKSTQTNGDLPLR